MATIKISDLHSAELEYQYTALTDEEQASIQGGRRIPWRPIWNGIKKGVDYGNKAANAVYVGTGLKSIHDAEGHWWSFL